jgi:hypothetical protein
MIIGHLFRRKSAMAEKVELVFEREKSKEKPKELIVRYLSTQMPGPGEDCEVYPQGEAMPGDV